MKQRLMMVAMVAMIFAATAATEVVDGVTWTYTIANGEATVGSGRAFFLLADGSSIGDLYYAMYYIYGKMGYSPIADDLLNYVNQETRLGLSFNETRIYGYKILE